LWAEVSLADRMGSDALPHSLIEKSWLIQYSL